MVYNSTRRVKMPFGGVDMSAHSRRVIPPSGKGMGSVLLRTGGGGSASSYQDIDDYIRTTGINPYTRTSKSASGSGMPSTLSSKLSKLSVVPNDKKKKNIVMSF